MIPGSCSTRLKAADATMLYSAGQLAGRIKLTASGRPAMMRRSVRKQGSCPDDILMGRLAAEAPRSGVYGAS